MEKRSCQTSVERRVRRSRSFTFQKGCAYLGGGRGVYTWVPDIHTQIYEIISDGGRLNDPDTPFILSSCAVEVSESRKGRADGGLDHHGQSVLSIRPRRHIASRFPPSMRYKQKIQHQHSQTGGLLSEVDQWVYIASRSLRIPPPQSTRIQDHVLREGVPCETRAWLGRVFGCSAKLFSPFPIGY